MPGNYGGRVREGGNEVTPLGGLECVMFQALSIPLFRVHIQ
jgi:hypothetical protein